MKHGIGKFMQYENFDATFDMSRVSNRMPSSHGFAFVTKTMDDNGAFDLKQGVAKVQYDD